MKDNQFNNDEVNIYNEPVLYLDADKDKEPEEGIALCLSGGGYRAMLFHAGVM